MDDAQQEHSVQNTKNEQYITHIEVVKDYLNIKKGFIWEDIPPFAVITGENGSGKSALLEGIDETYKNIYGGKGRYKKVFAFNEGNTKIYPIFLKNRFNLNDNWCQEISEHRDKILEIHKQCMLHRELTEEELDEQFKQELESKMRPYRINPEVVYLYSKEQFEQCVDQYVENPSYQRIPVAQPFGRELPYIPYGDKNKVLEIHEECMSYKNSTREQKSYKVYMQQFGYQELQPYLKYLKRNQMDIEKFYFSSEEEIKQLVTKDRNYLSEDLIFNQERLEKILITYHINRKNLEQKISVEHLSRIRQKEVLLQEENTLQKDTFITHMEETIISELGNDPLISINKVLKKHDSKILLCIDKGEKQKDEEKYRLVCKNKEGVSIPLNQLSTGEQLIISFFMWQYENVAFEPVIFLLDEPDAHLNPKMAKILVDNLKNVIVKKFNCQVIMTTHSLSTVAYCDDEDLFYMEDGKIISETKQECIDRLGGKVLSDELLETIQLIIDSPKMLFVEGKSDKSLIELYSRKFNEDLISKLTIHACNSATKMEYYAKAIKALQSNIQEKCLFLVDNDEEGRRTKGKIDELHSNTQFHIMFVDEGQQKHGGIKDFIIENLFTSECLEKVANKLPSQWKSKEKNKLVKMAENFQESDFEKMKVLVEKIKDKLKINSH